MSRSEEFSRALAWRRHFSVQKESNVFGPWWNSKTSGEMFSSRSHCNKKLSTQHSFDFRSNKITFDQKYFFFEEKSGSDSLPRTFSLFTKKKFSIFSVKIFSMLFSFSLVRWTFGRQRTNLQLFLMATSSFFQQRLWKCSNSDFGRKIRGVLIWSHLPVLKIRTEGTLGFCWSRFEQNFNSWPRETRESQFDKNLTRNLVLPRFARLLGDHQTFKSKKFLMLILDRVLTSSPLMLDCDPKFGITEAERGIHWPAWPRIWG